MLDLTSFSFIVQLNNFILEVGNMAPQDKSQFKKFDNILARISDTIDSGKGDSIEIYDEIKN